MKKVNKTSSLSRREYYMFKGEIQDLIGIIMKVMYKESEELIRENT